MKIKQAKAPGDVALLKAEMNWKTGRQRNQCGNCRFSKEDRINQFECFWAVIQHAGLSFPTYTTAICDNHERAN
jgi:hypothetical protein